MEIKIIEKLCSKIALKIVKEQEGINFLLGDNQFPYGTPDLFEEYK